MSANTPDPQLPVSAVLCLCAYVDDPDQQTGGKYNIEAAVQMFYPDYKVVWSAQQTPDYNYAYIVRTPENRFFLAIRGSLPFEVDGHPVVDWGVLYNWFREDFNVFGQVPWPYGLNGGSPSVANGAWDAFTQLQGAVDVMGSNTTAYTFLKRNAVTKGYPVYITGHSLGGNMADTYASYFADQLAGDNLSNGNNYLFTFAAPAAGNADFVTDLQAKFPPGRSCHYEIDNDIIPKFPVVNSVYYTVSALYSPSPQAEDVSITVHGVTVTLSNGIVTIAVAIAVAVGPSAYVQTPVSAASHALSPEYQANTFSDWFYQAAYQHAVSHYVGIFSENCGEDFAGRLGRAAARMTKSRTAWAV
jgi:hypothetical protein